MNTNALEQTISRLTAMDLQTGEAILLVRERHSCMRYIDFLKILDEKYLKGDGICIFLIIARLIFR